VFVFLVLVLVPVPMLELDDGGGGPSPPAGGTNLIHAYFPVKIYIPWAVNLAAVILKPSQFFNSLELGLRAHDKDLTETSRYAHLGTLVVEGMAEGKLKIVNPSGSHTSHDTHTVKYTAGQLVL